MRINVADTSGQSHPLLRENARFWAGTKLSLTLTILTQKSKLQNFRLCNKRKTIRRVHYAEQSSLVRSRPWKRLTSDAAAFWQWAPKSTYWPQSTEEGASAMIRDSRPISSLLPENSTFLQIGFRDLVLFPNKTRVFFFKENFRILWKTTCPCFSILE